MTEPKFKVGDLVNLRNCVQHHNYLEIKKVIKVYNLFEELHYKYVDDWGKIWNEGNLMSHEEWLKNQEDKK